MLTRIKYFIIPLLCSGLLACAAGSGSEQDNSGPHSVPDMAQQTYDRAVWLSRHNRDDEAIALFNRLTKKHTGLAPAYTNLGLLHLKQKDYTAAEQALQKSVQLDATNAIAWNHLGVALRLLGRFREAEVAYLQALKLKVDYADAVLNAGILYDLYLHDLPKALVQYTRYQTLMDNKDQRVIKWIADLETRIKRTQQAVSQ